jgi:hypothetical protein
MRARLMWTFKLPTAVTLGEGTIGRLPHIAAACRRVAAEKLQKGGRS